MTELKNNGRRRGFEALAVILLSLATVGMAWCSYQASGWNTRASKLALQSSARGRDAESFRIKGNQMFIRDMLIFSEYVKARAATNDLLTRFYRAKFSPELKQADEVWMTTKPFENPDVPLNPFATNLYKVPLFAAADSIEKQSEWLWYESGEAARTGSQYTLISVLLATALFFGGTAPRFQVRRKRFIVLVLGLLPLLVAIVMFLSLPRSKEGWTTPPEVPPDFIPSGP